MGSILLANLVFILCFYKELKVTTFDPAFAKAIGFLPGLTHLGLVVLVSITSVAAFDAVGSILVVALMSAPAAAAYLLTDRLARMLLLAPLLGMASAVAGYGLARVLDASISGAMATAAGGVFLLAFLFAPRRGLISQWQEGKFRRARLRLSMLAVHLFQHQETPLQEVECREDTLFEHLLWSPGLTRRVVEHSLQQGLVEREKNFLQLTRQGRKLAMEVLQPGQAVFSPGSE